MFRYRYDTETGLYYLQSRYYSPDWGRFINADGAIGQIGNIQGHNMFQYCLNNPVMMSDASGCWPTLSSVLRAVAVVAVCVVVVAAVVATGGLAACAIAGVSGGAAMLGGGAALVAAAETVAFFAAITGAVAAVSSSIVASVEKKLEPNQTVYKLVDPVTKATKYVGRTVNPEARKAAHAASSDKAGLDFVPIKSGLNYYQARGLEQIGILQYNTLAYKNKINGISPNNRNLGTYMAAGRGPALQYISNQISNEILNWDGR